MKTREKYMKYRLINSQKNKYIEVYYQFIHEINKKTNTALKSKHDNVFYL